jgi:hypothetical protein
MVDVFCQRLAAYCMGGICQFDVLYKCGFESRCIATMGA